MLIPIILCGGSGTRLWPLSRKTYPKQFLILLHEETMLQKTVGRLQGLEYELPIFVCNEEHRFIVAEQARQAGIDDATIILEPIARNTLQPLRLQLYMPGKPTKIRHCWYCQPIT